MATSDLPTPNATPSQQAALAPSDASLMIEARGLNKYFGERHVLKDVDFAVKRGECVAVIGPSGSGKSTLIRCINYLPIKARGPRRGTTARVAPREVMVALLAAQQRAASAANSAEPSDCDVLRVIAEGERDGAPMRLVEEMVVKPYQPWMAGAGDVDTGVPLAIAGMLLASGAARQTGAHGAELIFDPLAFLRELERYGMRATETATRTLA